MGTNEKTCREKDLVQVSWVSGRRNIVSANESAPGIVAVVHECYMMLLEELIHERDEFEFERDKMRESEEVDGRKEKLVSLDTYIIPIASARKRSST